MSVVSYGFLLVFLPLAVAGRRLALERGARAGQIWLVAAGAVFCGWASPASLLVLGAEGALTYRLGAAMTRPGGAKKPLLACGVAVALGALGLFKYTAAGAALGWLMPLGLSFSTFQQLFWLRDCYYGQGEALTPLEYACCLTLFPVATSGPILRPGEMAGQLRRAQGAGWEDLAAGLECFALGLGKKVLVAGVFAAGADWGFPQAGALPPGDAAAVILCYTLEIYFDFSGYCDMAWGMGRMLGLRLPVNFDSPYRSTSLGEFWGRWHSTLSRFFRWCVYIPLGGSHRGTAATCRNLMVVFLLSGLWHGAGWGFVIWGALHGAGRVAERLLTGRVKLPKALAWATTFTFVALAWVFFRAESVDQALGVLGALFQGGWALPTAGLTGALALPEVKAVASLLDYRHYGWGLALTRAAGLLALPLGMALLALKNPVRRGESFRPTWWGAVGTGLLLVWCLVSLTGVKTFVYANF